MPDGAVEKFFEIRNSFSDPDLEKGQKNFRLPSISRPQSISLALFLFNIGRMKFMKSDKATTSEIYFARRRVLFCSSDLIFISSPRHTKD